LRHSCRSIPAGRDEHEPCALQEAAELSPDAPQYREYLGEYYHSLKQSAEALATWRTMRGKKPHADNLAALAEVLAGFGYIPEASRPSSKRVPLRTTTSPCGSGRLSYPHVRAAHADALKTGDRRKPLRQSRGTEAY